MYIEIYAWIYSRNEYFMETYLLGNNIHKMVNKIKLFTEKFLCVLTNVNINVYVLYLINFLPLIRYLLLNFLYKNNK